MPFRPLLATVALSAAVLQALPSTAAAQLPVPASYRVPRAIDADPRSASMDGTDPAEVSATGEHAETEEAWSLFGPLLEGSGVEAGGWLSLGYHSEGGDLFNSEPDRINLHQGWLFAEKAAESNGESLGFGFRFDALFGTDSNDTVSFGNGVGTDGDLNGWDAGSNFQRGSGYGFALPQAYVEMASDDWSVKAGHFYTLIGYEVVGAPGNFFYSHAITMYNSEPFTHSGVLASYQLSEDSTLYGGWTAGWDTGFEQFADGSSFLGGISTTVREDVVLAYMTSIGDFGARGSDGFMQSLVVDAALSDRIGYVVQSDLLSVGSTGEDTIGLNQYLFYTASDRMTLGARFEWWKADAITGYAPYGGTAPATGATSHFSATVGVNYQISSNVMLRPEYRYDWSGGADYDQGIFGIDLIATF